MPEADLQGLNHTDRGSANIVQDAFMLQKHVAFILLGHINRGLKTQAQWAFLVTPRTNET